MTRVSTRRVRDEAQPLEFAGLDHPQQLRLLAEWHVGDFVEEQRALIGELEAADAVGLRVGESAAHVPKSSLSNTPSDTPPEFTTTIGREARLDTLWSALRHDTLAGAVLQGSARSHPMARPGRSPAARSASATR